MWTGLGVTSLRLREGEVIRTLRMEQAKTELTAANRLFKNAKFEDAVKAYGNLIKSKYMQDREEEATVDGSRSWISEEGDTRAQSTPGSVFGGRFDILFDAHLNRSACYSMIGEWEFATLDALKCKEMNSMSIKTFARLATAYQGAGDHKACMKECRKGLEIRGGDIALQEIWKKSDRILHPENYSQKGERGDAHVGSHDHSHEHGHSHNHNHARTHTYGSHSIIPRMGSYESDFEKDEFNAVQGDGNSRGRTRKTPEGRQSCFHDLKIACCL